MQAQNFDKNDTKIADIKSGIVPTCLYWTCEEVCDFFQNTLNLPEYRVSRNQSEKIVKLIIEIISFINRIFWSKIFNFNF